MKSVRVRMYRQGLGDCFLLSFPKDRGEAHVLIDCGVLKGTEATSERIQRVATSIVETTQGRLDALVVTHQHWDHVSGFLQAQSIFECLQIREVWLAWTEDTTDALAHELTVRKALATSAVRQAALRLGAISDPYAKQTASRLNNLLAFHGEFGLAGQQTTARAMDWVKARTGARVRYLTPGSTPFESPAFDNLRIFVLGPPRDPKMLRKSNPSTRASEVYELAGMNGTDLGFLTAASALDQDSPDRGRPGGQPFDKWFRMTDYEAWDDPFFDKYYGFEGEDDEGWRRIESDWLGAAGRLALQLDSHTNNTSLVLAFELLPSKRVLLFPGDAQVGNWLSWGRSWLPEDTTTPAVAVTDLLARTVLYKVGHHGSHNATLRELGLELMSSNELTAMLSVDRKTAKKMDWQMPFPSLFRRLVEKTNGRILDLEFDIFKTKPDGMSKQEWGDFLSRTEVRPDWIDYRIEM
jgi:hypothetical protein